MNNLNPYNLVDFKNQFVETPIYKQIKNDFDVITWEINIHAFKHPLMTPREYRGSRIFSAVPFYYILQLGINSKIYDLGCGWNIYKKYLPEIVGIDNSSYADEQGLVDDEFVIKNEGRFDNVMSMNALHFISLTELPNRIRQVLKMTKTGGLIFIMMNVCNMLDKAPSINDPVKYIRDMFDEFKDRLICFELDEVFIHQNMSEGTLRFILKK